MTNQRPCTVLWPGDIKEEFESDEQAKRKLVAYGYAKDVRGWVRKRTSIIERAHIHY